MLVALNPEVGANPFLVLRELPLARVYLGAICDAAARVREWVEIWVQTPCLRDLTVSRHRAYMSNDVSDHRWTAEYEGEMACLPDAVIVSGMETSNPAPLVILRDAASLGSGCAESQPAAWRLCRDDALLVSLGLPPYATSPFRYLYNPDGGGGKTLLAASTGAPVNAHVAGLERLTDAAGSAVVFNPHAGLIRVKRFWPLGLEEYLRVLEGHGWSDPGTRNARRLLESPYAELQTWAGKPPGPPFLLYDGAAPEHLTEIFFLKLVALLQAARTVRTLVMARQLPLLNLLPESFRVSLEEVGEPFPVLWTAKVRLIQPSQAYPLQLKSTRQRYFIRLGSAEPSPFLPAGAGAPTGGLGAVLIRKVLSETAGTVLEGTLRTGDCLGLDADDLLWFKLPLGEEPLEFYAQVCQSEPVGPTEARFRTVPAQLSEFAIQALKRAAGTLFPRSPYEVWPLQSSPCDLFSLGVLAVRVLLANALVNLPVTLDEVLSLARRVGQDTAPEQDLPPKLRVLLDRDPRLLDLASPHALTQSAGPPAEAWARIPQGIWLETLGVLLRLFPGVSPHSFCRSLGDVSPLALETVFDRPIQELEALVLRLRSLLVPSLSANEEIAGVLLDELAGG